MFSHMYNNARILFSAWTIPAALAAYAIGTIVYRLFFHQLSRFPGPRLAAATQLYEIYFDVVKGGQFFREIQRLHSIYGPIVRINPYEIHINDPDYYDVLYSGDHEIRDKYDRFVRVISPTSAFATVPHDTHRIRRGALESSLSKKSIFLFEPIIRDKLNLLCESFEAKIKSREVFELHAAYTSLATDIITEALFGSSGCWNCLKEPRFATEWKNAITSMAENATLVRYIPWVVEPLQRVPYKWILPIHAPMGFFLKSLNSIQASVVNYLDNEKTGMNSAERTILSELHRSGVPDTEKSAQRLFDEGTVLVTGGMEPLPHLMRSLSYHLLSNPEILGRVRHELDMAMPEPTSPITWAQLEKLPYFKAVMQESLRISAVVTTRLPRISPERSLTYGNYRIPCGIPVSMTTHFILLDPTLFPEPLKFKPERWTAESTSDVPKGNKKYLVPFSKGTRNCVGQHLAMAQAYMTIATMFRRFEFELYKTTAADVRTAKDGFTGQPSENSKGVRARVIGMRK